MHDLAAMQRALATILLNVDARRLFLDGGPLPAAAGLPEENARELRETLLRQRDGFRFFAALLDRKRYARITRLFPATAVAAAGELGTAWHQWVQETGEAAISRNSEELCFAAWFLQSVCTGDERIEGAVRFDRARLLASKLPDRLPAPFGGDPTRARVRLREGVIVERLPFDYAAMLRGHTSARRPAIYVFRGNAIVRVGAGAARLLSLMAAAPVDLSALPATANVMAAIEALWRRGIVEMQEASS